MSRPTAIASNDSPQRVDSYAKKLTEISARGRSDAGHPDIFIVPMGVPECKNGMYCSYNFGEKCWEHKTHKVIMLVGATGAGKSTLINRMINYILGVKWEDEFRFKLVDEHGTGAQSKAYSQTQITSSYTIHNNKQLKIPYTLTIIDTPGFGDTSGIDRDKAIVEQIREFFSHPKSHGVDHIDAVGFVVQATQARLTPTQRYIFDSTLSLFGKDMKSNIILLVNFWDGSEPVVIEAIKVAQIPYSEHKFVFNNAALFGKKKENKPESDSDSDEEEEVSPLKSYWQRGMKETKRFFETVSKLEAKNLTLSKEVLEKRKRLKEIIEGLQSQAEIYKGKMGELQKEQEKMERCQRDIEDNKSFEYEAEVIEHEEIVVDAGRVSMNCRVCQYTCHYPCTRTEKDKSKCYMMERNSHCRVCPKRCPWGDHLIQNKRHVYGWKTKMKTFSDIERRYRDATDKKPTFQVVIGKLKSEIETLKQAESGLLFDIHALVQRLEEIALKPHPVGINEYIDLLIESEQSEAKQGWQQRVKTLQSYKGEHSLYLSVQTGCRQFSKKLHHAWNLIVNTIKATPSADEFGSHVLPSSFSGMPAPPGRFSGKLNTL